MRCSGRPALGDIGTHFPPSDAAWKDADSRDLLRRAVRIIRNAGWMPVNIDSTVVCETPKIVPYAAAMRANIAADIGIDAGTVNVKGKTSEGLGFTGTGEGIAAYAVALDPAYGHGGAAMRALIQRVVRSDVRIGEETVGAIEHGMTVLLGVGDGDTAEDAALIARKIATLAHLRATMPARSIGRSRTLAARSSSSRSSRSTPTAGRGGDRVSSMPRCPTSQSRSCGRSSRCCGPKASPSRRGDSGRKWSSRSSMMGH